LHPKHRKPVSTDAITHHNKRMSALRKLHTSTDRYNERRLWAGSVARHKWR
jgi:hypothetical protein